MIVAAPKPVSEILAFLGEAQTIVLAGCKGCVTACRAGGEEEVREMAARLREAGEQAGRELTLREFTCERQCEPELLEPLDDLVVEADALVSLACSVGPQLLAARYPYLPVYPGVNTLFIGGAVAPQSWQEFCVACGDCIIQEFGGLCPLARCAKQMLNGPCGGASDGLCEVGGGNLACVWHLIFERLKNLRQLRRVEVFQPPKDWSRSRHGGPRTFSPQE